MIRFTFRKGLRLIAGQRVWTLLRRLANGKFQLEDEQGEIWAASPSELLSKWQLRELIIDEASLNGADNVFYFATPRDLSSYTAKEQDEAKRRHTYIIRLAETSHNFVQKDLEPIIKAIADDIGDPSPPHATTVYRWWLVYRITKSPTKLIDGRERSGRRRGSAANEFFEAAIAEIFLDQQKHPGLAVYEEMVRKIANANRHLPAGEQIKCPSRATVYRWLASLEKDLVDRARLGNHRAERNYRPVLGQVNVTKILERVEVDHSPLDLIVIDEATALPLGRPWITVAMDRYSRVILGFYICFHAPSSFSILQCLKRAILPKENWLAQFPDIKGTWPCFGVPELIASDNGMDLHSEAFQEICREMGINQLFCPAKEPEYKGAIERFFRTINQGLIHRLPGTVFSNVQKRGEYPSEEIAAITLTTLTHLFTKWVVEIYHRTVHRGVSEPPLQRWLDGLAHRHIELPAHPESLDVLVGIPVTRVLFKYGLEVDSLCYNSPELQFIFGRNGANKRLKIKLKYYEDDVGYIHALDPFSRCYLRVPAVNQEYAGGLSRHLHRMIRESVRGQQGTLWSQAHLLEAKAEIQEIVSRAIRDKKMASRKRSASALKKNSENLPSGDKNLPSFTKPPARVPMPEPLPDGLDDDLPSFSTAARMQIRSQP